MYIGYKTFKMQSKLDDTNLSSFYRARFDSFLTHLLNAKQLKEEDIHKLRVDIKNIRGLLLLLEGFDLDQKIPSRLLKQVRPVFRSTGRLRTIQVCKSLLHDYPSEIPTEIMEQLESKNSKVAEKIKKSFDEFDNNDKFQKRLDKLYAELAQITDEEVQANIDEVIHNELDIIYKLWTSARGEEHFHDIRKFMKIIKTLLQLSLHLEENEDIRKELDIVNQTETILGKWNDRDDLELKLAKIQKALNDPKHNLFFRKINAANRNEKKALVKEFHTIMRTHFMKY